MDIEICMPFLGLFKKFYPCHLQKTTTSDHHKNEKLPLSDCLVCFDRKISSVLTLFLEVFPALPENAYKKEYLII